MNPNGICVMAGVGGAGWHDDFAKRLAGELNAYVASRFVRQKFIAYIAVDSVDDAEKAVDVLQRA